MAIFDVKKHITYVASFSEAWIEIQTKSTTAAKKEVASFSEAWIEITQQTNPDDIHGVASFSEAWIEMQIDALEKYCKEQSPPSRRRGLKY